MQRDRFVRMRGLFVGLGGHTKWVSSATTFTSFVFKVRREQDKVNSADSAFILLII